MLANPYQGEVGLKINGEDYRLRLSLGALAALEAQLGEESLSELIERFSGDRFSSQDIIFVLEAGLYGGGYEGLDIAKANINGGAKAAASAAFQLLALAFQSKAKAHALS